MTAYLRMCAQCSESIAMNVQGPDRVFCNRCHPRALASAESLAELQDQLTRWLSEEEEP